MVTAAWADGNGASGAVVDGTEGDESAADGSGTDGDGADGAEVAGIGADGRGADNVVAAGTEDVLLNDAAADCAGCIGAVCGKAVVDIGVGGTVGIGSGTHCNES